MSRICELTGKGRQVGHNVSHANNKTKRVFLPNLQNVTLMSEKLDRSFRFRVSTHGLRSVEHNGGLDNWLLKTSDDDLSARAVKVKRDLKKAVAYRHRPGCSAADRGRGGSQSGRGTSPDWRARDERQMTTPRDIGLVSFNRDVHPTEAMDEIGAHAFHFARDMHTHAPRMHFFKQHAQLQFSQACADATVNAMAE